MTTLIVAIALSAAAGMVVGVYLASRADARLRAELEDERFRLQREIWRLKVQAEQKRSRAR